MLNVSARTAALYDRVRRIIPPIEWPAFAGDIDAVLDLKRQRNAVILAHNYQTPEIFHCVADIVGDSLALARKAMSTKADVIVLAGVHFMAETAKLLNPQKTVLIPDLRAGCSLADSITAEDIRLLRQRYPGVPVVTYVNTSAEVKAESDICCTSGNAKAVVESLGVPQVIMLPDEYLAHNIAAQTEVQIIAWKGHCEVHERFTPADIRELRESHPGVTVLAHPECPPEVVIEADFSGSTAAMSDYVERQKPPRVVLMTECSMSDNV
ncbi:MAG: quinolinate synthase NadA, partial [Mesorhizobium sp.]